MTKLPVSKDLARTAKDMLYVGKPQIHVAAVLGISQASVSRLKSGTLHPDVPWPTGDQGAIPIRQERDKQPLRWSESSTLFQAYPEILQIRIFEIVNVKRAAIDLPPIPEVAPEYEEFLKGGEDEEESDEGDPFEMEGLEKAQLAEDRRICQVMKEFDDILEEDTAQQRCEEIFAVLAATRDGDPRGVPELDTPQTPLIYRKMPWEEVCERGGRVNIVQKAIASDDLLLCEACCIVLYELRTSLTSWDNPAIEDEIYKVRERLSGEPGKLDELRRSYDV